MRIEQLLASKRRTSIFCSVFCCLCLIQHWAQLTKAWGVELRFKEWLLSLLIHRLPVSEEEEEQMLVDWFTLIHEKHLLVRREAELVYTWVIKHTYELRQIWNVLQGNGSWLWTVFLSGWSSSIWKKGKPTWNTSLGVSSTNQVCTDGSHPKKKQDTDSSIWLTQSLIPISNSAFTERGSAQLVNKYKPRTIGIQACVFISVSHDVTLPVKILGVPPPKKKKKILLKYNHTYLVWYQNVPGSAAVFFS